MKGMVFTGCSFTHGHGLWTYGDFSGKKQDDSINSDKIHAFERYTQSKRFARLVANHFGSWEFVRKDYSGDDNNSIGILYSLFKIDYPIQYNRQNDYFDFDDISHVIFQTSYVDRCPYIFNQETKDGIRIDKISDKERTGLFEEWGFDNFEDLYNTLRQQWYDEIIRIFKLLESKGIKCYIFSVTNDYIDFIKSDLFMQDKFIKMKYNNQIFNTIEELLDYDKSLMILNDFENLKNPPKDFHPSLTCHKIIADSIIDKIEKNG
jgi:hypothetical protein